MNVQVLDAPQLSVAVNSIVCKPKGNALPLGSPMVCTVVSTPSSISKAVAEKRIIVSQNPGFVSAMKSMGQVIIGGLLGATVMVTE